VAFFKLLIVLLLIVNMQVAHQGTIHSADSCQALLRAVAGTPGYFCHK
jgi:hypothetical protein